ncbi:RNA polymerase sigma factor SigF [Streptomyces chiangmaiensis]|uniref:RNA polymerase sigma factor SigF n=1 Tax=Streptomyces chiangmaiensis TaxID=766497 RepID=A0ABU7FKB4_9ACTN|nr:RNA polymerase sigma factor SigF [Streptomyces chiangmaiensis]MED7823803.1 RNA polymerase sigma factor SigF [Streptomyces chiangmaiensis]
MRDEERGARELSAGNGGDPSGSRRMTEGVDGIPEQARAHPEDEASAVAAPPQAGSAAADEALPLRGGGRTGADAAPRSTSSGVSGASPAHRGPSARAKSRVREEPTAWGRVTGGTMSEHERNAEQSVPGGAQHDTQDRTGARAMFVELRKLKEGSPEYAELRNQLVRMHLPLVEHLARRFRNRGEPLDDLTQVATIGLIKSVDRFDPERGVEFSTYATPTVVGEIKRHFRDKGWAVRVPRRLQELRLALTTATAELSQQHGRSPTVHELAEKLAISEEEVLEGLESANAYSTLSLDVPDTDDESPAVADTLGAEDEALEGVEYRESLKPLLEDLPPREKRILLLRFFGNMTQSQIAQEVGISQMHVSRLLARTLAQLREKLLVEE